MPYYTTARPKIYGPFHEKKGGFPRSHGIIVLHFPEKTYNVDIDGAVQIVLQVTTDKKAGENDHIYFYDAYLQ